MNIEYESVEPLGLPLQLLHIDFIFHFIYICSVFVSCLARGRMSVY